MAARARRSASRRRQGSLLRPMPPSADELRQRFFAASSGCYWNPALVIRQRDNGDRIVTTTAELAAGEPLAIVQEDMGLSAERARSISIWDLSDLDDALAIAAVLYQALIGLELPLPCGFADYLQVLPTHGWYSEHHAVLKLFHTTSEPQRQALESFIPLLGQLRLFDQWLNERSPEPIDQAAAERAVLASATRTWAIAGMVPFIDCFNHSSDGCALNQPNHQLTAARSYSAGSEVHVSYGPKDALHLLSTYGFCSGDNNSSLLRGSPSRLAIALDPELEPHAARMAAVPYLLQGDLSNIEGLLAEARLCCIGADDLPAITNLADQFRSLITIANEHRAITQLLAQFKGRSQYLEDQADLLIRTGINLAAQPWLDAIEAQLATLSRAADWAHQRWSQLLAAPQ